MSGGGKGNNLTIYTCFQKALTELKKGFPLSVLSAGCQVNVKP